MRVRKTNVVAGIGLAATAFFMTYLVIDTLSLQYAESNLDKEELTKLEKKLSTLEGSLMVNQQTIDKIRETVNELRKTQAVMKTEAQAIRAKGRSPVNKTFASVARSDLGFAATPPAQCYIQMDKVYQELPFDNPDGGVWKQGWDVRYDSNEVLKPENKLRVFVMPHSHNDPGWIKTFEQYFSSQTKHILDNMVVKLSEDERRKFVWAEVSFFSMWWSTIDLQTQVKVKELLRKGQLEIVTGGWVMNDEANSFYYAIIEQLMLGHEWCRKNLGYTPNNGWAIDPFGMSPTQAYLLKRMGMDNMLIQRTHYSVKKHLAKTADLEFNWRQHWDHNAGGTDILAHMMPFYSYDVPHTCGPDPKICCQFDFARLPGSRITCPWRISPKAITQSNVKQRAETLLDQYRKKATLYKTNSLLIPLGDDFRYTTAKEWDDQYTNYQAIFDYVNAHPELNAELSFGTLQDYFDSVRSYSSKNSDSATGLFKSLSGDFFTYSDRNDNYWSGYYTSRPFYKNMDRILEGYLRAAEILYSMSWAEMEYIGSDVPELAQGLLSRLVGARQSLSLFQHHDGVTGTAKDHVMIDYGNKMLSAIRSCQQVISQSAHYLLTHSKAFYKADLDAHWYDLDDFRESHDSLPKQSVIQLELPDMAVKVVIFNSHAKYRSETVTIRVSDPDVRVYKINDVDGEDEEEDLPVQISPVFDAEGQISNTDFELSFLAQVNGLALKTFYVSTNRPEEGPNPNLNVASIRIHNSANHPFQAKPFDEPEVFETGAEFHLQNGYVRAKFSADGFLQEIETLDDKVKTKCLLELIGYGTAHSGDKSGAYLFMPDGPAKVLRPTEKPLVRIVEGKVLSYVEVFTPWMRHVVTLKSSPGPDGTGIQINNDVDIRQAGSANIEVGMRLTTDLESGDDFFTDLNGFQMIRRKRMMDKLPLQANYYPVPSMAYIQDQKSRLTLVSRQPLGGSSLSSGQLEILMDRRLMQDDNRGLFQGVTDNHLTPHSFYLVLERKIANCKSDEPQDGQASYPSLLALALRHGLINPMYRLIQTKAVSGHMSKTFEPVDQDASCDIEVVNMRTMTKPTLKGKISAGLDSSSGAMATTPSDDVVFMVHRQGFNSCYKPVGLTCSTNGGKISLEGMLPQLFSEKMRQSALTLLHDGMDVSKGFTLSIHPMEIYSFVLRR